MSIWTGVVEIATKLAAKEAVQLPVTGAGTLALQTKIFGFGATSLGEAASRNIPVGIALTAVLIGVAGVAVIPAAALKALDSNGDQKVSSADAQWARLKIWQDVNGANDNYYSVPVRARGLAKAA